MEKRFRLRPFEIFPRSERPQECFLLKGGIYFFQITAFERDKSFDCCHMFSNFTDFQNLDFFNAFSKRSFRIFFAVIFEEMAKRLLSPIFTRYPSCTTEEKTNNKDGKQLFHEN